LLPTLGSIRAAFLLATVPAMTIHNNILDLIGNTPMVKARHLDTGKCELFLKLENSNPGGSIKDRIGLGMILAAERAGKIKPGDVLVEGTAGNTGLALTLVARQKGYRIILVIPDKMSREKISHLRAMGAEVVLTRSDVGKGHPDYYQDLAATIAAKTPNAYFINQFGNPDNPLCHELMTGPEIWTQMGQHMDAIVFGVGSSGTMTGLSRFFDKAAPHVDLIIADPVGSILTKYINEGILDEKGGSWLVEGIGEDFLPSISDFTRVKKAFAISDKDSMLTGRELLAKEGIFGGSSTGTVVAAALRYCQEQTTPKRVVAFVCDTGNKYLSKMYNDYWMADQGFIERPQHGDLRDLITRPYAEHDTIVVSKSDSLNTAYARMKLYDISQLPVMEGSEIVGIIDESDILLKVMSHSDGFALKVADAFVSKLEFIDCTAPLAELMPVFDQGKVAIVRSGKDFCGLITRIDLLNYLRRRAG
jgi:cystathionine beta-synthase